MKIAITSGKGGVGKTFVATCLGRIFAHTQPTSYIDCDVEAPNAHLFLQPDNPTEEPQVQACITGVNSETCTYCGHCAKACYFNALVVGKNNAMAFPELCRWCGACQVVCPHDALTVSERTIGTIYQADCDNIDLHWATLAAGAGGMTVPLIQRIGKRGQHDLVILDSPPGTSCAVVETVQQADHVILVADPTRFGQHDLKLSVHLCRSMGIEPLVIVNRAGIGDLDQLRSWCDAIDLEILAEIPDSREIAELYSTGKIAVDHLPSLRETFEQISGKLKQLTKKTVRPVPDFHLTFGAQAAAPTVDIDGVNPQTGARTAPEIAVLSGKGGTGKTSLSACFGQLSQSVIADCDVDAADMHLLLEPNVVTSEKFIGGRVMSIDPDTCVRCGQCIDRCRWEAIERTENGAVVIHADACEGCGTCVLVCPVDAVTTTATDDGQWFWSTTRHGGMSHATLEPGRENSGKLVTLVRKNASDRYAAEKAQSLVVLDGSPGTGCPVIASVGGARAAIIVTEPTVSGLHDLTRILELTAHFKVPSGVVVNKADLNADVTEQIKQYTQGKDAALLGELPYDSVFIDAQQAGQTVLEYAPDSETAEKIKNIWKTITAKVIDK